METVSTNTLLHFTEFEGLCQIIQAQEFRPHYNLENIEGVLNWSKVIGQETLEIPVKQLAYPIMCFTDLPTDKRAFHKKQYGSCYIEMKSNWANHFPDLCPVIYVKKGSFLSHNLLPNILHMAYEEAIQLKQYTGDNYENFVQIFPSYLKIFEDDTCKYYDEREWRFVAWNANGCSLCLTEDEFYDKEFRTQEIQKLWKQKGNILPFRFNDIETIVVGNAHQETIISGILQKTFENICQEEILNIVRVEQT